MHLLSLQSAGTKGCLSFPLFKNKNVIQGVLYCLQSCRDDRHLSPLLCVFAKINCLFKPIFVLPSKHSAFDPFPP